ncbi:MAG: hypothetical protein JWO30_4244 [Fibrobacteres bacterium]|nr:hypothetical protein [Fibrobacterota bacterium]
MSRRMLVTNLTLATLAMAAWATVAPAAAVEIGNANFMLTFPSGWAEQSVGQDDSSTVLATKGGGAAGTAILTISPHQGELTAAEIAALVSEYAAGDSLVTSDQGSKVLGGKTFQFLELKKAGATGAEATSRYRIYFITQGDFLFEATTFYNTLLGATPVADIEAALATLRITASAGIRTAAGYIRPEFRPADHDILGRFQRVEVRKTPLFRLPAF